MTALGRWLRSAEPVLGFSESATRRLRRIALGWALVAVIGLQLATRWDLVDTQPGRSAFAVTAQPVFVAGFVVALVIAWRWEIAGGTLASFTAAGLAVFSVNQLEPTSAAIVIVAFAVPGLLWVVVDLHDFRPALSMLALLLVVASVIAGGGVAQAIHRDIYGPTHPSSSTAAVDGRASWSWVGSVTTSSAVVVASVPDDEPVGLVVSTSPDLRAGASVIAGLRRGDIVRFEITDLDPATEYHYTLEPADGDEPVGRFRTFPSGPASFSVAASSCARVGSNGAVFDAIADTDPLLFLITGDLHYANIDADDPDEMRSVMDLTLSQPAPSALYRSTAIGYVWDDHDFGGDGSDRTAASRRAVSEVYREVVPHYPLADDTGPINQAFTVGRVRFILTDVRSQRSPAADPDDATKTMLGAEQKAWLERELIESSRTHALVVWVNPVPWIAETEDGADHWGGYSTERTELADVIADNDIDNLLMLSGDAHMVAIDDGTNSDFSTGGDDGFVVAHAAALDRPGHLKGGPYSEGAFPGSGQFLTLDVLDNGMDPLSVSLQGRNWEGDVLVTYEFVVPAVPVATSRN